MPQEKSYITQEKHDELVKELDILVRVRRKEIAEKLEFAKSLGDLAENAEYSEARDDQAELEDRIAHIEHVLKHAEIVSNYDTGSVSVGATVVLEKGDKKEKVSYTLVGQEEADMSAGKISVKSPIGMALFGKKRKETFEVETPGGVVQYRVVDIK